MTGRSLVRMSLAASRIIRGWPLVVGLYPGRSTLSGQYQSMVACRTSLGTSTRTGPGRPVVAMWNASRMMRGRSSGLITSSLCLVTERVMPTVSHSWKASVPMAVVGTWPVMATMGTESMCAVSMPVTRLVAPGPLVPMQTPTSPEARA